MSMKPLQFDPQAAGELVNKLIAGAQSFTPPTVNIPQQIAATPGIGRFGASLLAAAERTGKNMATLCDIAVGVATASRRSLEDMQHHDEDLGHALEVTL